MSYSINKKIKKTLKDQDKNTSTIERQYTLEEVDGLLLYSIPLSSQKMPQYWKFIKLIAPTKVRPAGGWKTTDAEEAYCLKCPLRLKYGGGRHNTVKRHMERYHREDLQSYLAQNIQQDNSSPSLLKRISNNELNSLQPTRQIKKTKSFGAIEQQKLMSLLIEWFSLNLRPLNLIEDSGFINLIRYLNSHHGVINLPNELSLKKYLETTVEDKQQKIRNNIQEESFSYYSITTDLWISNNGISFLSFTLHFITLEFNRRHWMLEVFQLPKNFTQETISNKLESIIEIWNLKKEKLVYLNHNTSTFGNNNIGSNNIGSHIGGNNIGGNNVGIIKYSKMTDIIQTMNIVLLTLVHQSIPLNFQSLTQENILKDFYSCLNHLQKQTLDLITEAIKQTYSLGIYLEEHPEIMEKVKSFHKIDDDKNKIPIPSEVNCSLPWRKVVLVLQRLILWRISILSFSLYVSTSIGYEEFPNIDKSIFPSSELWFLIECFVTLLEPFHYATKMFTGEKHPSLITALPVMKQIESHLTNALIFDTLIDKYHQEERVIGPKTIEAGHRLRLYLVSNFIGKYKQLMQEYLWVPLLHPGLSQLKWIQSQEERQIAYKDAIEEMLSLLDEHPHKTHNKLMSNNKDENQVIDELLENSNKFNIFNNEISNHPPHHHQQLLHKKELNIEGKEGKVYARQELESYVEKAKFFVQDGFTLKKALLWWELHASQFKLLAPVARKWMAVSMTANMMEEDKMNLINRRSILETSTTRELVFLNSNLLYETED